MNTCRRSFVKGCAIASAFIMPGTAAAAVLHSKTDLPAAATQESIEKSIKAGFGGGFVLHSHRQSDGMTYAHIRHQQNLYAVASADLIDWKILRTI